MLGPTPTPVRCSSCGTPSNTEIRTVIDVKHDPEGKVLLVSGQLNSFNCPTCETLNNVKTPILYHDADKELLIAFVPQEIGIQQGTNEEKLVGDMLNQLTTALPKEDFRGYMFNPKRTLTLQGLINQILEADGITPEMLEQQQKRVDLIQELIETNQEQRIELIKAHDEEIDEEFFGTFGAMATRLAQSGQAQLSMILEQLQEDLLENSTFGQEVIEQQEKQQAIIEEVRDDIEALDENADKTDFLKLLWSYRNDEEKVQAMVGLVRPIFDYEFFQLIAGQIGKAPEEEQEKLEALRDHIHQLTQALDEQSKAVMQQLAQILQTIVNHPNPEQLIRDNVGIFDDNFMMILQVNMQQAQERGDQQMMMKLQEIHQIIVSVLQENMQPELRLVNELLGIVDDNELIAELQKQAPQYKDTLIDFIDAIQQVVASQGQIEVMQRIEFIKAEAQKILT